MQRTQSPSGDCNSVYILIRSAPGPTAVATHSIPFRGLQPAPNDRSDPICVLLVATHSIPFRGLQLLARLGFEAGLYRDIVATHSIPFRGLQLVLEPGRKGLVEVVGCNALNPLQGIATVAVPGSSRSSVASSGCNALNPLQGIATSWRYAHPLDAAAQARCNALNPLQGIATCSGTPSAEASGASAELQRTQSPSGDCNRIDGHGLDPLVDPVATHSIPFRGLQRHTPILVWWTRV